MTIIYFMMPLAFLLAFSFLAAFIRGSLRGDYDDLETPAHRILIEDERKS